MAIFATKYDKTLDMVLGQSENIRTATMVVGLIGIVASVVAAVMSNQEIHKMDDRAGQQPAER